MDALGSLHTSRTQRLLRRKFTTRLARDTKVTEMILFLSGREIRRRQCYGGTGTDRTKESELQAEPINEFKLGFNKIRRRQLFITTFRQGVCRSV